MKFKGKNKAKLSILIYHRVLPYQDSIFTTEITKDVFNWQMDLCSKYFSIVSLREAIAGLQAGTLKSRTMCITFDDGYADNYDIAIPILNEKGVPATFFIASSYIDGGIMWNDLVIEGIRTNSHSNIDLRDIGLEKYVIKNDAEKYNVICSIIKSLKYRQREEREALATYVASKSNEQPPGILMMSTENLKSMHRNGYGIGAHTVTHPILKEITNEEAMTEIKDSKKKLAALLQSEVDLFAYPNGKYGVDYTVEHVEMVKKAGFIGAVSTEWGTSNSDTDLWQLRRFTPWDKTPGKFFIRLLHNMILGPT